MILRRIGLISCLGVMGFLSLAPTNVEALLASVKTTGMAATGVAYPQDSLATAFNPAGMADVGDRIDMGAGHRARNALARSYRGSVLGPRGSGVPLREADSGHSCRSSSSSRIAARAHPLGRQLDRLHDPRIRTAAADVAIHDARDVRL